MEKQQIPNGTLVLVMGILSIVGCCCYGLPGIICGIVAIVLGNKATKIYKEAPEEYTGFGNVQAGKIMGIIGLVLGALALIYYIWVFAYIGIEGLQDPELMQEKMRELMGQ